MPPLQILGNPVGVGFAPAKRGFGLSIATDMNKRPAIRGMYIARVGLLFLGSLIGITDARADEVIVNGSFETPNISANLAATGLGYDVFPGNTANTISGWQITSGSVAIVRCPEANTLNGSGSAATPTYCSGSGSNQYLQLEAAGVVGVIEQVFTTSTTSTLTLNFKLGSARKWTSSNPSTPPPTVLVTIVDEIGHKTIVPSIPCTCSPPMGSPTEIAWEQQTLVFTPTSGRTRIKFSVLSTVDSNVYRD